MRWILYRPQREALFAFASSPLKVVRGAEQQCYRVQIGDRFRIAPYAHVHLDQAFTLCANRKNSVDDPSFGGLTAGSDDGFSGAASLARYNCGTNNAVRLFKQPHE